MLIVSILIPMYKVRVPLFDSFTECKVLPTARGPVVLGWFWDAFYLVRRLDGEVAGVGCDYYVSLMVELWMPLRSRAATPSCRVLRG